MDTVNCDAKGITLDNGIGVLLNCLNFKTSQLKMSNMIMIAYSGWCQEDTNG